MSELFSPVGATPLAPRMLIINTVTGELWEVAGVDELTVLLKSASRNCITSMPVRDMKPEKWLVCSSE